MNESIEESNRARKRKLTQSEHRANVPLESKAENTSESIDVLNNDESTKTPKVKRPQCGVCFESSDQLIVSLACPTSGSPHTLCLSCWAAWLFDGKDAETSELLFVSRTCPICRTDIDAKSTEKYSFHALVRKRFKVIPEETEIESTISLLCVGCSFTTKNKNDLKHHTINDCEFANLSFSCPKGCEGSTTIGIEKRKIHDKLFCRYQIRHSNESVACAINGRTGAIYHWLCGSSKQRCALLDEDFMATNVNVTSDSPKFITICAPMLLEYYCNCVHHTPTYEGMKLPLFIHGDLFNLWLLVVAVHPDADAAFARSAIMLIFSENTWPQFQKHQDLVKLLFHLDEYSALRSVYSMLMHYGGFHDFQELEPSGRYVESKKTFKCIDTSNGNATYTHQEISFLFSAIISKSEKPYHLLKTPSIGPVHRSELDIILFREHQKEATESEFLKFLGLGPDISIFDIIKRMQIGPTAVAPLVYLAMIHYENEDGSLDDKLNEIICQMTTTQNFTQAYINTIYDGIKDKWPWLTTERRGNFPNRPCAMESAFYRYDPQSRTTHNVLYTNLVPSLALFTPRETTYWNDHRVDCTNCASLSDDDAKIRHMNIGTEEEGKGSEQKTSNTSTVLGGYPMPLSSEQFIEHVNAAFRSSGINLASLQWVIALEPSSITIPPTSSAPSDASDESVPHVRTQSPRTPIQTVQRTTPTALRRSERLQRRMSPDTP